MEGWMSGGLPYWHWLILGMVLLGAEMFLSGFIVFWFGASALVIAFLSIIIPMSFKAQLLIWSILAITSVIIWNRYIRPGWKDKTLSGMASEALLGQVGMVQESNRGRNRGRLRFPAPILGEDEWIFMCQDEISVGTRVRVKELSGNTLIVEPI